MAENTLKCPKCGGEIRHTSAFCEHCGTPISITVSTQTPQEDATKEQAPIDNTQKEKEKEEYFKRRETLGSAAVMKRGENNEHTQEISVNPSPTYTRAALTAGFLLCLNIVVLAVSNSQPADTPILAGIVGKIIVGILVGTILPLVAIPLFNRKVNNVNRRAVRRSMRTMMVLNWLLCAAPLFGGLTLIAEDFLDIQIPMQIHNIMLLAGLVIFGIFSYFRYISIKQNKSVGEIQMALHFDIPLTFAVALFSVIVLIFALATAGQ